MMLYRLSFVFIYELIKKRNPDPIYGASSFVGITLMVHVLLLNKIIALLFDLQIISTVDNDYLKNKLVLIPVLLIWLQLIYWYFKRKQGKITEEFKGKSIVTWQNGIIVFGTLLIPLILAILLSTN